MAKPNTPSSSDRRRARAGSTAAGWRRSGRRKSESVTCHRRLRLDVHRWPDTAGAVSRRAAVARAARPAASVTAGGREAQVDRAGRSAPPASASKNSRLREAERPGDQHVGEGLDRGVVVEHAGVVVLAREADLVLGRRQLLLQLEHVLVRLQLGVVLDDREERAQRAGQRVLGLRLLGGALGAGGDRVGARLGDLGRAPAARSPCSS